MWNCVQCGTQNGENTVFCATCGRRKVTHSAVEAQQNTGEKKAWRLDHRDRICKEAERLELVAKIWFVVMVIIAALILFSTLLGSCVSTPSGVLRYDRIFQNWAAGAILAGVPLLAGVLGRLILRCFATVVEDCFRKLRSLE